MSQALSAARKSRASALQGCARRLRLAWPFPTGPLQGLAGFLPPPGRRLPSPRSRGLFFWRFAAWPRCDRRRARARQMNRPSCGMVARRRAGSASATWRYHRRVRILIVEDDASLAGALAQMLRAEGYAVDAMSSGEQAVLAARQEAFDLVILDIGLPGMDGYEVLRRLRGAGGATPVLVLTARDQIEDRVRGLDLGADDYMAKPFAMPELTARVRALIRRSQARAGPRVQHGPLTLDSAARRAYLGGAPLELAAREWAVLEVLLARVEHIVSKEAIIHAVTDWNEELSPNAIEVYISRLRAKLEPAGIRIRTVRGFGYMLEEYKES